MEYVFIVGAVQAFFLSIFSINKRNKSVGDLVMIVWFVLLGIMLMAYALEVMGIEDRYPILWGFTTSLPMLMGPITLLYILAYTKRDQRINPLFALNALPYVIFTIIVFIKMTLYTEQSVRADINFIEDATHPVFAVFELMRIFLGPIYLIISLFVLNKHTKKIGRYFSYTEDIDLKWIRNIVLMLVLIWVTVIIMSILSNWNDFIPWRLGDNLIYLMVTLTVFVNGYYGIKQQIIFDPAPAMASSEEKKQYAKSSLKKDDAQQYMERLLKYMEEEQPYLNGKLTLNEVAQELDITVNHLSQVINENLNKNFFDFVNGYRVEHIKKKMADPASKKFTLLALAYDSGFNSKSSFNSIFKKVTGVTPSQYMQAQAA